MSRHDIVAEIAKRKLVEDMVCKVAHSALTDDLCDLCQMVYLILLDYDEDKIQDLWEHNQINYFIARIVMNQYRSVNSPFHYLIRKYQMLSSELWSDYDTIEDGDHPLA